ncbi:unnamed protein product [Notodromas monacha]|uniref:EF-hand domain-containing protein n=1 Tax=Notodromas monacha TaxID=399045 RepID=A0A7R9BLD3_9CRUS|nr:unnamed protein product [Notodromas monacha]CAG0916145.1 unnamed protein product [Notodromas monacha]
MWLNRDFNTGTEGSGSLDLAARDSYDVQHIEHHMDVPKDPSEMTEQASILAPLSSLLMTFCYDRCELQQYYFKIHDSDRNRKLDGIELIQSLIHRHAPENKEPLKNKSENYFEQGVFPDKALAKAVDRVLRQHDKNNDGYIDYPEFIRAQESYYANKKREL